ncbi:ribonuclease P protein component [Candidatus Viridilinea mediisalina]|uniref:Ribonuclease P protein component n=1 Tax=Candidatus Viridilinea mediisalina TaxID=2024553 RepID=A0A2A6RPR0_9CHLR|nr:ribonuclease P protein component [Candidatus Viridilinea mediisalina]PDW04850.1 ribonuclease P protein component [Candidatus Viridilinea mediisalina]
MKRAYRLRRPEQFRRVRQEGRSLHTPLLTLQVLTGRRRRIRCGFVVTKRLGTAVQRNRAKRRLREAVRLALPSLNLGYDLVFVVRSPELITLPFDALRQRIEQLLRRAGLWGQEIPVPPS